VHGLPPAVRHAVLAHVRRRSESVEVFEREDAVVQLRELLDLAVDR
jgi:hypothetical protein